MNDSGLKDWLQKSLDVLPQNIDLYRTALTTRQYEALEFLGDSIIGFVVSEYLVKSLVTQPGLLTNIKSKIVNNSNLAQKAQKISLKSVASIPSTSSQEQITERVIADMLEALIGAVYQDRGLERCKDVIFKILNLEDINLDEYIQKPLNPEDIDLENKNPISALQEFLAKHGVSPPKYSDGIIVKGSSHCPIWSINVTCEIGNEFLNSVGVGNRKQKAKEEAARKLFSQVVKYIQN